MEIMKLLNALPGAVSQGVIWGIMAIGVYITYRILDVADLTVDGLHRHWRRGRGDAHHQRLQRVGGAGGGVRRRDADGLGDGRVPHMDGDSCHPIGHSDAACALFHQPWHHEQQGEHGGECE